jgi:hypothetical protein
VRSFKGYCWLGGVALGLAVTPAHAQEVNDATRAAARDLATQGIEALQAGNFPTAVAKLEKAFGVVRVPSIGLWLARALAKAGKLVEAAERYRQVATLEVKTGDVALQKQAKVDAEREADDLAHRIPGLVVQVQGGAEGATVTINGQALPEQLLGERQPVNPGTHHIEARRGQSVATADVSVVEGETKPVGLSFDAQPAAAASAPVASPSPAAPGVVSGPARPTTDVPENIAPAQPMQKTLGLVVGIAGAVGLAVGGVTGAMVLGRQSDFENSDTCADYHCLPSRQGDVDSYNGLRTIWTVALLAGGVLATTGVVLYLTAPRARERVALRLGASHVRLEGRFE